MLRLVTYYTPSHEEMCRKYVLDRAYGFDQVIAREWPQTCETGAFKQSGWNDCMLHKLQTLCDLPEDNTLTVYVDSDVCLGAGFAGLCKAILGQMPPECVVMSDDIIQWCAGVMMFRQTLRTRSWFALIHNLAQVWNMPDQDVIHCLRQQRAQSGGTFPVDVRVVDGEAVANWATVNAPDIPAPWDGEPFVVPDRCVAWHANWTVGVDRKMAMLEMAAEQMAGRARST